MVDGAKLAVVRLAGEVPIAVLASTFRVAFTERAKKIRD